MEKTHESVDPAIDINSSTDVINNSDEMNPLINDEVSQSKKSLTLCKKISYGLGHVLNDLCAAMWFSYILLFLQAVIRLESTLAGTMLLVGQITDGLATPVAGILVDRSKSRKMWHFIGTILVVLSFPMIFITCPGCSNNETWRALYFLIVIIIFQIGWAIVQISHLSMIPQISGPVSQRGELTAIRFTASVVSSVAFYLITWTVLHTQQGKEQYIGPQDIGKFKEITLIIVGIGIVTTLMFYAGLRKVAPKKLYKRKSIDDLQKPTIRNTVNFFLSILIYQVSLLYVAARLFVTLSLVYMPLFLDERQEDTILSSNSMGVEEIASVPLVSFIASFVASLCLKYWAHYHSKKMAYLVGSIICLLGCVWIGLVIDKDSTPINIYIAAILLGSGSAITMVTSLSITADMIGPHTDQGAFVYSTVTFADKVITGLAVVFIEHIKCTKQEECPQYYRNTLAYACGGAAIFGLIVLITLIKTKL